MPALTPELEHLVGKVISDLGGTANAVLVIVGDRLGLYETLAKIGPLTPAQLAAHTGTTERYIREWLAAQAASGYITYDSSTEQFSMSPEQAMLFADENSPLYMAGGFFSASSLMRSDESLADAFRSGQGIQWGDHHECLFCGTEKFFRPSYASNLIQNWIPALNGVREKLERGAAVADLGCGHGCSTLIMAKAFPESEFVGFDTHAPSIRRATELAAEQGLSNVRFEVATAQNFPKRLDGAGYDFITIFDALHDMGDPRGAARRVRETLKPGGSWMIVEPAASDRLEENLNPIGRVYYAFSAAVCVPSALSQTGGEALGAQAGPAELDRVIRAGGLSGVRVATQTPFNLVLEATA